MSTSRASAREVTRGRGGSHGGVKVDGGWARGGMGGGTDRLLRGGDDRADDLVLIEVLVHFGRLFETHHRDGDRFACTPVK